MIISEKRCCHRLQSIFIDPYREGGLNLKDAWNGKRVEIIPADAANVEPREHEVELRGMKRLSSFAVGMTLIITIPIINSIVLAIFKAMNSQYIHLRIAEPITNNRRPDDETPPVPNGDENREEQVRDLPNPNGNNPQEADEIPRDLNEHENPEEVRTPPNPNRNREAEEDEDEDAAGMFGFLHETLTDYDADYTDSRTPDRDLGEHHDAPRTPEHPPEDHPHTQVRTPPPRLEEHHDIPVGTTPPPPPTRLRAFNRTVVTPLQFPEQEQPTTNNFDPFEMLRSVRGTLENFNLLNRPTKIQIPELVLDETDIIEGDEEAFTNQLKDETSVSPPKAPPRRRSPLSHPISLPPISNTSEATIRLPSSPSDEEADSMFDIDLDDGVFYDDKTLFSDDPESEPDTIDQVLNFFQEILPESLRKKPDNYNYLPEDSFSISSQGLRGRVTKQLAGAFDDIGRSLAPALIYTGPFGMV